MKRMMFQGFELHIISCNFTISPSGQQDIVINHALPFVVFVQNHHYIRISLTLLRWTENGNLLDSLFLVSLSSIDENILEISDNLRNCDEKKDWDFKVSTVPADILTPSGARASAGIVISWFRFVESMDMKYNIRSIYHEITLRSLLMKGQYWYTWWPCCHDNMSIWIISIVSVGFLYSLRAHFLSMAEQGLSQWEKTLHM